MTSKRILRAAAVLVAAGSLYACQDGPMSPTEEGPDFVVIDGSTGGNPGVLFLAPVRLGSSVTGTFDPSVPLSIQVLLQGTAEAEWFTVSDGDIGVRSNHYAMTWRVPATAEPGDVFEIRAFAVSLELARLDLQVTESGALQLLLEGQPPRILDVSRTVPLRLWINTEAVGWAEDQEEQECLTGGEVIDCDVELVPNESGGVVRVFNEEDPTAPLAGQLTVDPGDVVDASGAPVDAYLLTLLHLSLSTKPSGLVPPGHQFPFILEATVTDAEGNPLFFATGASLVLCQPFDLETNAAAPYYLPLPQAAEQQIIKVDGPATVALPTTYGAPECEASRPVGVALQHGVSAEGLLRLARRGLGRLAGFLIAEPLRAGHGGLTTVKSILDLSEFAGALLTDPSVSTATVPNGVVGTPTVIAIQANVTAAVAQSLGGDDVVVTVTGANSATLTVGSGIVDHGDGTYTATYTPLAPGVDQVAISIEDPLGGGPATISGSPFTSAVASAGPPGLVTGIVLEPSGTPLSGVPIEVYGCTSFQEGPDGYCARRGLVATTTTDASGGFQLEGLPLSTDAVPGAYEVVPVVGAAYAGTDPSSFVIHLTFFSPTASGLTFTAVPQV